MTEKTTARKEKDSAPFREFKFNGISESFEGQVNFGILLQTLILCFVLKRCIEIQKFLHEDSIFQADNHVRSMIELKEFQKFLQTKQSVKNAMNADYTNFLRALSNITDLLCPALTLVHLFKDYIEKLTP